jgi:hypothetical protein
MALQVKQVKHNQKGIYPVVCGTSVVAFYRGSAHGCAGIGVSRTQVLGWLLNVLEKMALSG